MNAPRRAPKRPAGPSWRPRSTPSEKKGSRARSAREIDQQAGCNQGLVFYHFGTVTNLLLAALDEVSSPPPDTVPKAPSTPSHDLEGLVETAQAVFEEDLDAGYISVLAGGSRPASSTPGLGAEVASRLAPWRTFAADKMHDTLADSPLAPLFSRRSTSRSLGGGEDVALALHGAARGPRQRARRRGRALADPYARHGGGRGDPAMSEPDWLEPLLDAAQMRATDAWAIADRGIPSLELMERAGEGSPARPADWRRDGAIVVLAGKGNNGGDGFAAARILREQGRDVEVLLAGERDEVSGDAADQPRPPARRRGAAAPLDDRTTGDARRRRAARHGRDGRAARRDRAGDRPSPAASGARVLAADVPSGVDASSGEVAGVAVDAEATVTFHAAKPGLWIEPGRRHAGSVRVIDIGIPQGAPVASRRRR